MHQQLPMHQSSNQIENMASGSSGGVGTSGSSSHNVSSSSSSGLNLAIENLLQTAVAGVANTINVNARHDFEERPGKRGRFEQSSSVNVNVMDIDKLEYRLRGILCCAVCLDLPKSVTYQCQMGHLMCAACFTHLLADGRLRDQIATCPNCRVEISKSTASRNLAVEKAASELPRGCQYCGREYPYKSLERHETIECVERPTNCKYLRIGCQWRGPNHETKEHEFNCLQATKSGFEIMAALEAYDGKILEEKRTYHKLIDLLNYEKIMFNDLQLKPYRTDDFVLFYETARFSAFNHQWVVKGRVNNSQRDPHQSNERTITYQLVLKTKTTSPMNISFLVLKGPFSDMKVSIQIYKHEFTEQSVESDYNMLPLPDSLECNRLLSNKLINIRILMFMVNK